MPSVNLVPTDLAPFGDIPEAKAEAMIADALALAAQVAPCITQDSFPHDQAALAILRRAILRWNDNGTAATQRSQTAGPFSTSETYGNQQSRGLFWPSEIQQLQDLCRTGAEGGAFAIDTVVAQVLTHADICTVNFGGTYCSCGAILTGGYALYESQW